jgi:hypothetical protein
MLSVGKKNAYGTEDEKAQRYILLAGSKTADLLYMLIITSPLASVLR